VAPVVDMRARKINASREYLCVGEHWFFRYEFVHFLYDRKPEFTIRVDRHAMAEMSDNMYYVNYTLDHALRMSCIFSEPHFGGTESFRHRGPSAGSRRHAGRDSPLFVRAERCTALAR
jgi:hypothetical protein